MKWVKICKYISLFLNLFIKSWDVKQPRTCLASISMTKWVNPHIYKFYISKVTSKKLKPTTNENTLWCRKECTQWSVKSGCLPIQFWTGALTPGVLMSNTLDKLTNLLELDMFIVIQILEYFLQWQSITQVWSKWFFNLL